MFARRFLISFPIFATMFVVQEAIVSQFKIFSGGFSLFLVFALLWAALSLAGFSISYLGYGDDNFRGNPISLVVIVALAVPVTRLVYLIINLLLGGELGSGLQVFLSLLSSALWSVAIVPLLMPAVTRVHSTLFEEQSRG